MAASGAKNFYVRASGRGCSPEEVQGEVEQAVKMLRASEKWRESEQILLWLPLGQHQSCPEIEWVETKLSRKSLAKVGAMIKATYNSSHLDCLECTHINIVSNHCVLEVCHIPLNCFSKEFY